MTCTLPPEVVSLVRAGIASDWVEALVIGAEWNLPPGDTSYL
jgi:hypothetical protein